MQTTAVIARHATRLDRPEDTFNSFLKLMSENWEEVTDEAVGLLAFLGSDVCPKNLQTAALAKARYVIENKERWLSRSMPEEEEVAFVDGNNFFQILAFPEEYAMVKASTAVAPDDAAAVQIMAEEIRRGLVEEGLLVVPEIPVIVPIHGLHPVSVEGEDSLMVLGGTPMSMGSYISTANVVFISDAALHTRRMAEKIVAHELIHANEVIHNPTADRAMDQAAYPQLTKEHSMFVREGIVDWLANYYTTGNHLWDPVPDGLYSNNIAFVDEHIVPYLKAQLGDGEELAARLVSLLRRTPERTFLGTACHAVPGLQETLEKYERIVPLG